ncbi:MAG: NYN domain-containing protein, partial [Sedimentisphaerales bacterium]
KMVDILLAVDLVQLSVGHQIQRAVLLASDSDFVPAIQIARNAGTVVELYYHIPPRPHDELMSVCDDRIPIDNALIDKIKFD